MSAPTINDIPLEILQEIFLEACDHQYFRCIVDVTETSNRYPPLNFQHTLSAVSRRWRLTVSSFTMLWSNIAIMDYFNPERIILPSPSPCLPGYLTSFASAIRCAGDAPLTCYIRLIETMSATTIALLNILVAASKRWVSLDLQATKITGTSPNVFPPLYKNLPRLQSLKFYMKNGDVETLHHIFTIAPNLIDVNFGLHATDFILPWAQLRRVKFTLFNDPLLCIQNLQQSSKLEHFHYYESAEIVRAPDYPILILPSVKVAYIIGSEFLSLLALPSLETATRSRRGP